jgi:hypothetical protein
VAQENHAKGGMMPSSNSVDYSVNANDVIEDALANIGEVAAGEPVSSEDAAFCLGKLQRLVKQWQGSADYAPGLKMWSRKRAYVFLQKDQSAYSLGPTGDHASATYYSTTLDAAELAGQTIISVTSTANMTAADNIGIVLASGAIHWSTIASFVANDTVTIDVALPSGALNGARVFWYTTKMRRPVEILTAVLRDTDDNDRPLSKLVLQQYEALASKSAAGTPGSWYYESQLTNGVMYLDITPEDATKVVRVVFLSPIEDFDALTDTADVPQQWYRPLGYQLSFDIAPAYGRTVTPELKMLRDESLLIARNADPDNTTVFFEPGR